MEYINNELFEKLTRLQWLLQRQHMKTHAARGPMADPSRGQGRVLAMLKLQPEISSKDLSYLLGIRQQSLGELLTKLEKSGYIVRKPAEKDRRIIMVQLTEKGKAEKQEQPQTDILFGCLNPDEQAAFGEYLDRIITALEAQLGIDAAQDMSDWRSRMGDAVFQRMHQHHHGHPQRGHGFFGGPDRRGPHPHRMPGAEHFLPDCDDCRPGMPPFAPAEDTERESSSASKAPRNPDDES